MKTILITGASGNLGVASVKKFLESGCRVIAVGSDSGHLSFARENPLFNLHNTDLSDESLTDSFIQELIEKYKRIDAAVLLVGGFAAGDISATSGPDLDKMISLNFKTAYFVTRPLLEHMVNNGYGRIIFTGARPALKAEQGKDLLAYALSKSLLFKLADFINETMKGKNIMASVVVPSTIDTPANRSAMPGADPSNWVRPEQVAAAMEFITSEQGSALRETVLKVYHNA